MKKFIKVYDDFLPLYIQNYVEDLLINSKNIRYTYFENSSTSNKIFQPGFNYHFIEENKPKFQESYFTPLLNVIYSFCNFKKINIENIFQGRVWLSVPSPHPLPEDIHIDLNHPHWVLLYYVNDADGDTILFDNNKNEIKRVTPKKGRCIFFDGSILHCGSQPSKTHRVIINFDFNGEIY